MRKVYKWRLRTRALELGRRTLVMGVVNVTPDSFWDGGKHFSAQAAVKHGLKLLDAGADILDIGGESTRPGAVVGADASRAAAREQAERPKHSVGGERNSEVSEKEELSRVLPVIEGILKKRKDAVISVDTYKA